MTALSMTRRSLPMKRWDDPKDRAETSSGASKRWAISSFPCFKSTSQQWIVRSSRAGGSSWLSNGPEFALRSQGLSHPTRTWLWIRSYVFALKRCRLPIPYLLQSPSQQPMNSVRVSSVLRKGCSACPTLPALKVDLCP